jgi:methionyl-tRNA synthetase
LQLYPRSRHPIADKWGILVGKVDDKAIQRQKEKLGCCGEGKLGKSRKQPAISYPEIKPLISIDEFAKVDLRPKSVASKRLKKSKKLIKMRIDIGSEQRTILAEIAQHYEPEQLIGKTVIVVVNLEPATLMGQESQGMVLAGVYGDDLSVTAFEKSDVPPGATVR